MLNRRERPEETSRSENGLKEASQRRPATLVRRPDPESGREKATRPTASRKTHRRGRPARNADPLPPNVPGQPGRMSRIARAAKAQNRTSVPTIPGVAIAIMPARQVGKRAARPPLPLSEKNPREKIKQKSPPSRSSQRKPPGKNLPRHPTA